MNKTALGAIVVAVLAVFLVGAFSLTRRTGQTPPASIETQALPTTLPTGSGIFGQESFENIKSAHYVSSEPANNTLFTQAPSQIKVNFNFTLASPSKIQVTREGKDVTEGQTQISADKLSLSVPVNARTTGNYKVTYTGCWPDGSCHNGSFGFSVEL